MPRHSRVFPFSLFSFSENLYTYKECGKALETIESMLNIREFTQAKTLYMQVLWKGIWKYFIFD